MYLLFGVGWVDIYSSGGQPNRANMERTSRRVQDSLA
jgi:hypothetical protein